MSPALLNEFNALYARTVAVVGDAQALLWLSSYEQAFGRKDWERFESLRAFPLFLRNENRLKRLVQTWLVDLALWEWTEFNVLYSPMDEEHESVSLEADELLLNPTAQILRLESDLIAWVDEGKGAAPPGSKVMALLFRVRDHSGVYVAKHKKVEWTAAALLDVLLENGRTNQAVLWREIQEHHGPSGNEEWRLELSKLIDAGVILRG